VVAEEDPPPSQEPSQGTADHWSHPVEVAVAGDEWCQRYEKRQVGEEQGDVQMRIRLQFVPDPDGPRHDLPKGTCCDWPLHLDRPWGHS